MDLAKELHMMAFVKLKSLSYESMSFIPRSSFRAQICFRHKLGLTGELAKGGCGNRCWAKFALSGDVERRSGS